MARNKNKKNRKPSAKRPVDEANRQPDNALEPGQDSKKPTFNVESLEPRILLSASWVDADTGDVIDGPTDGDDIYMGDLADNLADGGAGDDILFGNDGDDTLIGGAGNDMLFGGAGDDILDGGGGNDMVDYSDAGGGVTVDLGTGTASGAAGTDTISNVENVTGSDHDDTLTGDASDNVINGGAGDDTIDGGSGTDTADYSNADAAVTVDLAAGQADGQGHDTISNVENVIGGVHNDVITGNDEANVLDGDAGNDTISAGAGNDMLDGGAGDDVLDGGAGDDILRGGAGHDVADYSTAESSVTVNFNEDGVDAAQPGVDTLTGVEEVVGSQHDDTFAFGNPANGATYTVDGGGGHNTLDLGNFSSDDVTFRNGTVAVDMGDGQSFSIEHENINSVQCADKTMNFVTWDGEAASDDATDAANWSNDSVPGENDILVFNDTSDSNAVFDAGFANSVGGLLIDADYDGTITLASDLELDGDFVQNGGAFVTGAHKLDIAGDLLVTDGDLTIQNECEVSGNITQTGGSINADEGTLILVGDSKTIDLNESSSVGNLEVDMGSSQTLTLASDVDVTGDLTITMVNKINDGSFNVAGNVTSNHSSLSDSSTGTIKLTGNGDQVLSGGGVEGDIPTLEIAKDGGTITISDAITVDGDLTGGGANVSGDLILSGNSKTVELDPGVTLENLEIDMGSSQTLTLVSDVGVTGDLTITMVNKINDGSFNVAGNVTSNHNSLSDSSTGTIKLTGDGDQVLSGGGVEGDIPSLHIDKTGGTITISDAITVDGDLTGGGANISGDLILCGYNKMIDLTPGTTLDNLEINMGSSQVLTLTNDVQVAGNLAFTNLDEFHGASFIVTGDVSGDVAPIEHTGDGKIIIAGTGDETLTGTDNDDTMRGGEGNDVIDGGAGTDTVDYGDADSAVSVNLNSGQASGGDGSDSLIDIENVTGSDYNDTIRGDAGANVIDGGAGNDSVYGGDGADVIDGGAGNDSLRGEAGDDVISGGEGNDSLYGGTGDDVLDGGAGSDYANYYYSDTAVDVNLADGTATGEGTDTLSNIENVTGSQHDDTLTGDDNGNTIYGQGGDDVIDAGGGNDSVYAGEGADVIDGGSGDDSIKGDAGDDVINAGTGNDSVYGGAGDDVLDGGDGSDYVKFYYSESGVDVNLADGTATGEGVDTLTNFENVTGSQHDDAITGDDNDNRLYGYGGDDTINAGAGNDTVYGGEGADLIDGGAGNDYLKGEAGDDMISGGTGNDTLYGGTGDDVMDGGEGVDTANYYYSAAGVEVNLADGTATGEGTDTLSNIENVTGSQHDDTITGDENDNRVYGYGGDDVINTAGGNDTVYAGDGADVIDGGAGNDYLKGEAGDDTISGGTGNDTLYGGSGDDLLSGGAGDDYIRGESGVDTVDYSDAESSVTVDLSTTSAQDTGGAGTDRIYDVENLTGSDYDDTLTGTSGDNVIIGGAGKDVIDSGAGDDQVDGGAGNDNITTGDGADVVDGGVGNDDISTGDGADIVDGGIGNDDIDSGAGDDHVFGGAGNDNISTGDGADFVDGGDGADVISAGAGDDTLIGGMGHDILDGGSGTDTVDYSDAGVSVTVDLAAGQADGQGHDTISNVENVIGGAYDDVITGNEEANVLDGGAGDDTISAGAGDDTLIGGAGDDVLDGGAGDDTLIAGTGDDILRGGEGHDVADYSTAESGVTVNFNEDGVDAAQPGVDTLTSVEEVVGSQHDDTFAFGNPADGATYTIDGGGGQNTLDLSNFSMDDATFDAVNGIMTIDMGDGESFTIDYDNLHTAEFSDATIDLNDIPPIANAGVDQTVEEDGVVTLDASGSYDPHGDTMTYQWVQVSGPTVTLSDATAVDPTFTAPNLLSNTDVTFELHVIEGDDTTVDTMNVTINADNDAPTADAGTDQTVDEGDLVQLHDSSTDPEGQGLTYEWTQTSGPSVTLSDPTAANPTFTAPEGLSNSEVTFELSVSDGENTSVDTMSVTINADNDAPSADAGADQTVDEGDVVTLSGSGTDPEDQGLTYEWVQTGGPNVTLSDPTAANPTFTAPNELSNSEVTFELHVSDGENTSVDTMSVTINADNDAPTANAGVDQTVNENEVVTLSGSGTDPEGQGLTYEWVQTGGPNVTLSDASAANPTFTAPEGLSNSEVTFELHVSDGENTSVDTMSVTINADNDAPSADAGADQTVDEGDVVTLSGSGTDPEDQGLTYEWVQTGGPNVTLSDPTAANPTFTAPEGLSNSEVTFELSVSDGENTSVDTMSVTINADNDAPSADAGADQTVDEGDVVTLSGSGTDPEDQGLT
ncbi:MAG: Ig-like domain-containing protein, partial [Planctomycetota bacterium]